MQKTNISGADIMADSLLALGFLVNRHHHENAYFKQMANAGKKLGVQLIKFRPADMDLSSRTLTGICWNEDAQKWEKHTVPFPSFIYDRALYGKDESSLENRLIANKLKKDPKISFLNHGLPNKWKQIQILKTDPFIAPFLPETNFARHPEQVEAFLGKYDSCIMKPSAGSGGRGIIVIRKHNGSITLYEGQNALSFTQINRFYQYLAKKMNEPFIVQPLLSLRSQDERPFDLRILFQKNEQGYWAVQGKGIRIGKRSSFLANLSKGASVLPFERWKKSLPSYLANFYDQKITVLGNELPNRVEKAFPVKFELGIDIGIDFEKKTIWVLDINSKPGRKVALLADPARTNKVIEAPIRYALYLQSQMAKRR